MDDCIIFVNVQHLHMLLSNAFKHGIAHAPKVHEHVFNTVSYLATSTVPKKIKVLQQSLNQLIIRENKGFIGS